MKYEIKGVHNYHISEKSEKYLQKKCEKLAHFKEIISDIHFSLERESSGEYKISSDLHFRKGHVGHIEMKDRDLFKGIDILVDKINLKATKEKELIQGH